MVIKILKCQVCGSSKETTKVIKTKRFGNDDVFCQNHYYQMCRRGKTRPLRDTPNSFTENNGVVEMELYDKEDNVIGKTYFSYIHKEFVSRFKWFVNEKPNRYTKYVCANENGKIIYLHRFIYELINGKIPKGLTIDHEDRNGFNNLDENLKLANQSEQNLNQRVRKDSNSGIKGVCYSETQSLWLTQISYNGLRKKSYSKTKEEAISKREEFEKQIREGVYFD